MTKHTQFVLILVATLIVGGVTKSWIENPRRSRIAFMSHLYHQRYAEASRMLRAPSAIEVGPDGALTLTDCNGNSTVVQSENLPFMVGGGRLNTGDSSMTALGPSTSGILNSPPAVLYLSYNGGMVRFGGKISIESVGER